MPNFMNKHVHAYLDYPVGLSLIILPLLLGIGGTNELAFWLSTVTGVAALILTFFTDHHLGVVRLLPYKLHLAVDFLVGVTFVIAPTVLGFSGLEAMYFWVLGATVLVVVALGRTGKDIQVA